MGITLHDARHHALGGGGARHVPIELDVVSPLVERFQDNLNPLFPTYVLVSVCGGGTRDLVSRHNHTQAVVPGARQPAAGAPVSFHASGGSLRFAFRHMCLQLPVGANGLDCWPLLAIHIICHPPTQLNFAGHDMPVWC